MRESPPRSPRQTARRHNRDTLRQTWSLESRSYPAAIQARFLPPVKTRIVPAVCLTPRRVTCDHAYHFAMELPPAAFQAFFVGFCRHFYLICTCSRFVRLCLRLLYTGAKRQQQNQCQQQREYLFGCCFHSRSFQNFPLRPEPPPPDSL